MATFSANGFPEISPGEPLGTGWHDQANYNDITAYLASVSNGLGANFFTGLGHGCGVSPHHLANYLRARYFRDFSVRATGSTLSYGVPGDQEVHSSWLSRLAFLDGALGMLSRRTYAGDWDDFVFDAVQKTGPQIGTPRKNHLDGLVTIMLGFEGTLLGHADIVGLILGQLS